MTTVDFEGGVAVITGAARGLGEGIARAAARRGMRLALADILAEPLEALARELRDAGVDVLAVPTDIADPASIERLATTVHAHFGDVRLVVNNAAIVTGGLSWDLSVEQWQRIIDINILGVVLTTRAFASRMVAAQRPAAIANVASLGAMLVGEMQAPYFMTKHAVLGFTESLALDMALAAPMIQVTAVLPSSVRSSIFAAPAQEERPEEIVHRQKLEKLITDHGMDIVEAGETVFAQIEAGTFWSSTDPALLRHVAAARADYLRTLDRPTLAHSSMKAVAKR